MAEKLEPCPFCGGGDIHVYIMTTASRAYAVCDMCDAVAHRPVRRSGRRLP